MLPNLKAAGLTTKFSTKPADYNAVRVRNNQRRHRARVKAHVAELEDRLIETQNRLDAALNKVSQLTSEVDSLRKELSQSRPSREQVPSNSADFLPRSSAKPSGSCCGHPASTSPGTQTMLEATGPAAAEGWTTSITNAIRESISTHLLTSPQPEEDQEGLATARCRASRLLPEKPKPSNNDPRVTIGGPPDVDCSHLPPPAPGESTTPCMSAYQIIEQQNFSGLDVAAIRSWLEPGFRRALQDGDGCRVQTNLLFALLDYISSTSDL